MSLKIGDSVLYLKNTSSWSESTVGVIVDIDDDADVKRTYKYRVQFMDDDDDWFMESDVEEWRDNFIKLAQNKLDESRL